MGNPGIPPDLNFGPFALIQAAVSLVIVGGAIMAWMRGSKRRESDRPTGGVQVHVDGPIQAALDYLKAMADAAQGLYRVCGEFRSDIDRIASDSARRKEAELDILRDIRNGRAPPPPIDPPKAVRRRRRR